MVDFRRQESMSAAMARQKTNILPGELPHDIRIRRSTIGRLQRSFLDVTESLEIIQTASTEYSDHR
jgi:hypothetical protein